MTEEPNDALGRRGRGSLSVPVTGWHSPGPGAEESVVTGRHQGLRVATMHTCVGSGGNGAGQESRDPAVNSLACRFCRNRIIFKNFSLIALGVTSESLF